MFSVGTESINCMMSNHVQMQTRHFHCLHDSIWLFVIPVVVGCGHFGLSIMSFWTCIEATSVCGRLMLYQMICAVYVLGGWQR